MIQEEAHWLHIREVAIQGVLYVIFFYISYTPGFIIQILERMGMNGEKETDIYPLLFMNSFLIPLQGFFNVL